MNPFNNFNSNKNYQINFNLEVKPDPNNPEETEEISKKITQKILQKIGIVKEEINNKEIKRENIEKHIKDFLEYKENDKKLSPSTIKNYNSSFKYLLLLSNKDTIYNFNYFINLQKHLRIIPSNMTKFTKYKDLKIEELEKIYKKEKYDVLKNQTINKHIKNYNNFFNKLKNLRIIDENPVDVEPLLEEQPEKNEYKTEELIKIFKDTKLKQELNPLNKANLMALF